MDEELEWLAKTCRTLGRDINLVQGTGGNISSKFEDKMFIKSSGVRLTDVTKDNGYVIINHNKVSELYEKDVPEDEANAIIKNSVIGGIGKPSIETGFHSFLKKYVIHLHPVSLNVILCSKNVRDIISSLFNDTDFIWVPYFKVGHNVSAEIKKRVLTGTNLIFLQNHGVIISSNDPDCTKNLDIVMGRVNDYLKSKVPDFFPFTYTELENTAGVLVNTSATVARNSEKILKDFLFPDAAVFATSDKIAVGRDGVHYHMDFEHAKNIDEILSAHAYLHEMSAKIGGPKIFTADEVADLLGMESEKYRRKLIGL